MDRRTTTTRRLANPARWLLDAALAVSLVSTASAPGEAEYATSAKCAPCHNQHFQRWQGSHHDLAMQKANETSVLGDFADRQFTAAGKTTRFFRRDGKYWVHTTGPGGKAGDFAVSHTFGVEPLQQYLVALPGGRLQALDIAWDSRAQELGGQRWFHLSPDDADLPASDPLHWSGPFYNWNSQCADCHSTHLRKGYDATTATYQTTWQDIDVGCEACHGPGAAHADWSGAAEKRPRLPVDWSNAKTAELNVCSPCHSRRSLIAEPSAVDAPFLDHYVPDHLRAGLYYNDGQILDEVYVYGSFVQSKMHARGVGCGDCHEPHSLQLRVPGNALCVTCHNANGNARFPTLAKRSYDAENHHHHTTAPGNQCVTCHMPGRTYMQIDERRDHGFRIPMPHLSPDTSAPNPCTACHTDRDPFWATAAIAKWTGKAPAAHWSTIIAAARKGSVTQALADLSGDDATPAIVRATAIEELAAAREAAAPAIQRAARDTDPLVRVAAARALDALPPEQRIPAGVHLLRDPRRAVRSEAAYALVELAARLPDGFATDLGKAVGEYRSGQEVHADRPMAHHNLGSLFARQGRRDDAKAAYQRAIEIGPYFTPAYVNLADFHRIESNEKECERVLRSGLKINPNSGDIRHALGLSYVRQGRVGEALTELEAAASITADNPRYAYVYALALNSRGNTSEALRVMQRAAERHPANIDILLALAGMYDKSGNEKDAEIYKQKIEALGRGLR